MIIQVLSKFLMNDPIDRKSVLCQTVGTLSLGGALSCVYACTPKSLGHVVATCNTDFVLVPFPKVIHFQTRAADSSHRVRLL